MANRRQILRNIFEPIGAIAFSSVFKTIVNADVMKFGRLQTNLYDPESEGSVKFSFVYFHAFDSIDFISV